MKHKAISMISMKLLSIGLLLVAGKCFAFEVNAELEDDVLTALAEQADTAYLQSGDNELQLLEVDADGEQLVFQKMSDDLEILGNKVIVYMDDKDQIIKIEDDSTAKLVTRANRRKITADDAMDVALENLQTLKAERCDARLVWFRKGDVATLAWQVEAKLAPSDAPASPTDMHIVIDAETGDMLSQTQIDTKVYKANPKTGIGVFPRRIVINDAVGPAGSRAFALNYPEVCAISGCTATLIAPDVLISARHCGASPGDLVRFGPNRNSPIFVTTISSVILPDGGGSLLDGGDVAIVLLNSSVPAGVATPMRLIDETNALVGETCATIGYGFNGVGSTGHGFSADGFRWGGENVIDVYGSPASAGGTNIFSTDFDNGSSGANTIPSGSATPLTNEATTAPGDSGGPIIVNIGGENLIAGVLSGGTTNTSVYGDISWWTGTSDFRSQIEAQGGQFAGAMPPPNDDWSNTIFIADPDFNVTGTNVNGTTQADEQNLGNTGSTVWWYFDADVDGEITIDTFGSDYDTQLHVYEFAANFADLTLVANNDDTGGLQSQVTFQVTAGTCYEIRVGGYTPTGGGAPGSEGEITLNGTFEPDCQFALGDINEDGVVDFSDIEPFVDVVFGGGFLCQADINGDGVVDFNDIEPFVELLFGN